MSWIDGRNYMFAYKSTKFNTQVCLRHYDVITMAENFDGIFDNFTKFVDEIASLQVYPVHIEVQEPSVLGNKYRLQTAKGVANGVYAKPFLGKNCFRDLGEFYVEPYYHNFADYKGYTQVKAFLPYLGYIDIDTDLCMGKYLQFRLYIDFASGKGLYIIGVSEVPISHKEEGFVGPYEDENLRIIATYETRIGIEIPLGQSNAGDIKRNLLLGTLKTAAAVGASIYTGSLAPPVSTTISTKTYDIQGRSTRKGSRMKQIKSGTEETVSTRRVTKPFDVSKPISEAVDGSIDVLNRNFVGSNSDRVGDSALMVCTSQKVQVIIYRPRMMNRGNGYENLMGKPVGSYYYLWRLGGYTEISSVHIEGEDFARATSDEIKQLQALLTSPNGVILPGEITQLQTFYVNGTPYSCCDGEDWFSFVDSSRNINNLFSIEDDEYVLYEGRYITDINLNSVYPYNVIDPNMKYKTI